MKKDMQKKWNKIKVPTSKIFRTEIMTGKEILKFTDMYDSNLKTVDSTKTYIVVFHHNIIIDVVTDEIRIEDENFYHDITYIPNMFERIYTLGYLDGISKSLSKEQTKEIMGPLIEVVRSINTTEVIKKVSKRIKL